MQLSDIVKYYNEYMDKQNQINKETRYDGKESWFHASGAGNCHLKHLLNSCGIEGVEQGSDSGRRLMRLGTLVHEDVQSALSPLTWKRDTTILLDDPTGAKSTVYEGNDLLIEHEINIPTLNVRGFLDIADINHKDKSITIFDIKTTASYKWSFIFGRKVDDNPTAMYELQISTYAMGLAREYPNYALYMWLLYYKKDNSDFREKPVGSQYLGFALDYWMLVNEFVDNHKEKVIEFKKEADIQFEQEGNGIMVREDFKTKIKRFCSPGNQIDIPVASWECNELYCKFHALCPTIIKKKI